MCHDSNHIEYHQIKNIYTVHAIPIHGLYNVVNGVLIMVF